MLASVLRGSALACALSGAGLLGCANLPGMAKSSTVQSVVERGAYLDVELSTGGSPRRFFTPARNPARACCASKRSSIT